MKPELAEVWDDQDDWTGLTSAKERRRRQNRLHQRAYRWFGPYVTIDSRTFTDLECQGKRRHLQRLTASGASAYNPPDEDVLGSALDGVQTSSLSVHHSSVQLAAVMSLPIFSLLRCPGLRQQAFEFLHGASLAWSLNLPRPSDLPTLSRFNAFDGLARNALMLQIPACTLEDDNSLSPFNHYGPLTVDDRSTFPVHLFPTALQRTVVHHPWLDLFPIPGMRDNILRGMQEGRFDEDQLCDEICCELVNVEASSSAPLIIWGNAWDANAWEFSIAFIQKWNMLFEGCPEVLRITNYWRQQRGAMQIEVPLER
jgi:hypothetical protein